MIFLSSPKKSRIFASALDAAPSMITPWLTKDSWRHAIRSMANLAHLLLARVGRAVLPKNDVPIKAVLNDALRSLGWRNYENVESTLEAVNITLGLLQKWLRINSEVIFEKPLLCWPNPQVMVEGFARYGGIYQRFCGGDGV